MLWDIFYGHNKAKHGMLDVQTQEQSVPSDRLHHKMTLAETGIVLSLG